MGRSRVVWKLCVGQFSERGQSNVIGVVLVTTITVLGVTGVLAFGTTAITDAQRDAQIDAAEHAMTQLDSRISLVGLGESESQRSPVALDTTGNQVTVREGEGWMNVSVVDPSTGSTDVLMNESLGEIVYENGDTKIAYQGGGVWKKTRAGTSMVSPPEFHYRPEAGDDATLTLPLVVVKGSGTVDGDVELEAGTTTGKYPLPGNPARSNPLSGGLVNVTVSSEYYRAWGRFFETRTGGDVVYDHGAGTVTISLQVPQNQPSPQWAFAGTGSGTLEIWEWFGDYPTVDAYNSSDGAYAGGTGDATIAVSGDLEVGSTPDLMGDGPQLETDFEVGGYVNIYDENAVIDGNVSAGTWIQCDPPSPPSSCPQITGTTDTGATVESVSPITGLVQQKVSTIEQPANNNNSDTSAIGSDDRWDNGGSLTLTAGTYYVESKKNDLNNRQVTLDTTGGNITIAMVGPIKWSKTDFEVTGPDGNFVRIYYVGDTIEIDESNVGDTSADDSTQLRIYGVEGIDVSLQDGTRFVGMIYAPGSASSGGSVRVGPQGYGGWGSNPDGTEVYGAIVGSSEIKFGSDTSFHYDEALRGIDMFFSGSSQPKVTYLHVTVNEVNVTDG